MQKPDYSKNESLHVSKGVFYTSCRGDITHTRLFVQRFRFLDKKIPFRFLVKSWSHASCVVVCRVFVPCLTPTRSTKQKTFERFISRGSVIRRGNRTKPFFKSKTEALQRTGSISIASSIKWFIKHIPWNFRLYPL